MAEVDVMDTCGPDAAAAVKAPLTQKKEVI